MNEDPLSYHNITYKQDWRVKRLSLVNFKKWTRKLPPSNQRSPQNLSRSRFVLMNALNVLQLLGVIPFAPSSLGGYQAQTSNRCWL